ncbi:MAG: hypothetical protein L3J52_08685 [Proteobacteria bacterium]|nr:hypothetical protein [Pseudomonadota bacterium]
MEKPPYTCLDLSGTIKIRHVLENIVMSKQKQSEQVFVNQESGTLIRVEYVDE